eukprot:gene18052-biopygen9873
MPLFSPFKAKHLCRDQKREWGGGRVESQKRGELMAEEWTGFHVRAPRAHPVHGNWGTLSKAAGSCQSPAPGACFTRERRRARAALVWPWWDGGMLQGTVSRRKGKAGRVEGLVLSEERSGLREGKGQSRWRAGRAERGEWADGGMKEAGAGEGGGVQRSARRGARRGAAAGLRGHRMKACTEDCAALPGPGRMDLLSTGH